MAMDLIAGDATAGSEDAVVPREFSYVPSDHEECARTPDESCSVASEFNHGGGIVVSSRQLLEHDEHLTTDTGTVDVSQRTRVEDDMSMKQGKGITREDKFFESRPKDSAAIPSKALQSEQLQLQASHSNLQVAMRAKQKAVVNWRSPGSRGQARAWKALLALIRRPYWSRVWVLQEVAIARSDPLLICGMRSASWHDFQTVLQPFQSHILRLANSPAEIASTPAQRAGLSATYHTAAYNFIREHVQKKSPSMSLQRLLMSSLTLESTDPRDKVYALMELAHDSDQASLVPDYSKTVEEVYIAATKHLISMTGKLNLFSYNANSPNSYSGSAFPTPITLPSWVSDWSLSASRPYPLFHSGTYKASNNSYAKIIPSDDERGLLVDGFVVDAVHTVSEVLHGLQFDEMLDHLENLLNNVIRERLAIFPSNGMTPREREAWWQTLTLDPDPRNSDSFWRTLIANVHSTLQGFVTPAPDRFAEQFEVLRYDDQSRPRKRLSQVLSTGLPNESRLRTSHPSKVPDHFLPHLSHSARKARYVQPLKNLIEITLNQRRFFVTRHGLMGIASKEIQQGDLVTVLLGADMPYVLRPLRPANSLRLIGESYVHGMMNGEALTSNSQENLRNCTFTFELR